MKLEKEQIKKLSLALMLLVALLYGYFTFLLGPLQKAKIAAVKGIETMTPQLADAKNQITKTAALEAKAPQATAFLKSMKNSIPDGAPIAWFPPRMAEFFKKHGIEKSTTRLLSETPDTLPGFKKISWMIDVPRVESIPLGEALATLENEEPLMTITMVSIEASPQDAQYQHATFTLTTRVKS